jgi:hypothetical protein
MVKRICGIALLLIAEGCGSTGPETSMNRDEAQQVLTRAYNLAYYAESEFRAQGVMEIRNSDSPRWTGSWERTESCYLFSFNGNVVRNPAGFLSSAATGEISLDNCLFIIYPDLPANSATSLSEEVTVSNVTPLETRVSYEEADQDDGIRVFHKKVSVEGLISWVMEDGRDGRCDLQIQGEVLFTGASNYTLTLCGHRFTFPES